MGAGTVSKRVSGIDKAHEDLGDFDSQVNEYGETVYARSSDRDTHGLTQTRTYVLI